MALPVEQAVLGPLNEGIIQCQAGSRSLYGIGKRPSITDVAIGTDSSVCCVYYCGHVVRFHHRTLLTASS